MSMRCPECGGSAVRRFSNKYKRHFVNHNYCDCNESHRFKTIEVYAEDIPELELALADMEEVDLDCEFCRNGDRNKFLNSETSEDTDLEVFIGRNGDVLRVRHYDIEGDAYDTKELVHINFCPMCGRGLRKK